MCMCTQSGQKQNEKEQQRNRKQFLTLANLARAFTVLEDMTRSLICGAERLKDVITVVPRTAFVVMKPSPVTCRVKDHVQTSL